MVGSRIGYMGEPRWLNEREERMWRTYHGMRRQLDAAVERQLAGRGLSMADYQLLMPLSEAPTGRLRARELRRLVDWDRSRLAHQMRRMEQRGLIAREDCPTDARGTVIRLTDTGLRAVEAAAPGHVETVRRYFVDLLSPEEIDSLTAIGERVLERLAADPCASATTAPVAPGDTAAVAPLDPRDTAVGVGAGIGGAVDGLPCPGKPADDESRDADADY
jgi:DNA-binding MarR family transcriptional regulator